MKSKFDLSTTDSDDVKEQTVRPKAQSDSSRCHAWYLNPHSEIETIAKKFGLPYYEDSITEQLISEYEKSDEYEYDFDPAFFRHSSSDRSYMARWFERNGLVFMVDLYDQDQKLHLVDLRTESDNIYRAMVANIRFNLREGGVMYLHQIEVKPTRVRQKFGTVMLMHCIDQCIKRNLNYLQFRCDFVEKTDLDLQSTKDGRIQFFSAVLGKEVYDVYTKLIPTRHENVYSVEFKIPVPSLKEKFSMLVTEQPVAVVSCSASSSSSSAPASSVSSMSSANQYGLLSATLSIPPPSQNPATAPCSTSSSSQSFDL